jgi:hypothetical protein
MMKPLRRGLFVLVLGLAGLGTVVPAGAHGYYGGVRGYWYGPSIGFYYGGPYGWGTPGYYGPGYYGSGYYGPGYGYAVPSYGYVAPGVVLSPGSVVYIERDQAAAPPPAAPAAAPEAAPGGSWWYLCSSPRGAYPYVRECPGGWERVPALPPGPVR